MEAMVRMRARAAPPVPRRRQRTAAARAAAARERDFKRSHVTSESAHGAHALFFLGRTIHAIHAACIPRHVRAGAPLFGARCCEALVAVRRVARCGAGAPSVAAAMRARRRAMRSRAAYAPRALLHPARRRPPCRFAAGAWPR
jgi:hypothetical protein